jgi:Fe-S-cluster-containing dehydrogenase component
VTLKITRRSLFSSMAVGAASSLVTGAIAPAVAQAEETAKAPQQAVGMLYDATRCVGCQACVSACAQAGDLVRDAKLDSLRQNTRDLTASARSSIKLYKTADGSSYSFVKRQCMHCIDAACVAACMFRALIKNSETGIVSWNPGLCVGCRYCEIVCPYHIPRFQWHGVNPRIVKCEFCRERLAQGKDPACTSVCPTQAVVFGKRTDLIAEAAFRTAKNPEKYFEHRAFGEGEGGGTQVLYLSHAPFDKLGLPKLSSESIPAKYLKWQKRVYAYLVAPAAAYAVLVGLLRKRWKRHEKDLEEDEESSGLRPQL